MGSKRQLLDELRLYDINLDLNLNSFLNLTLTHLSPKYFNYILKENVNIKQRVIYIYINSHHYKPQRRL